MVDNFFYSKNVFVTGGTGFIGDVLLRTLVEKVSSIGKIYSMYRQNVGFEHEKIVWIKGDLVDDNFGMSLDVQALLLEEVDVVYHLGAYPRWDMDVVDQVRFNTVASLDLIDFFLQGKRNPKIYMATSYWGIAHIAENKFLGEYAYQDHKGEEELAMLLNGEVPDVCNKYFNGYSYSKELLERLVDERYYDKEVYVARISSVIGAVSFPEPGYSRFDISAAAMLKCVHKEECYHYPKAINTMKLDVIPVDVTVNMLITHAAYSEHKFINICGGKGIFSFKNLLSSYPLQLHETFDDAVNHLKTLGTPNSRLNIAVLYYFKETFYGVFLYRTENALAPLKSMTEWEKSRFFIDVNKVDWERLFTNMIKFM